MSCGVIESVVALTLEPYSIAFLQQPGFNNYHFFVEVDYFGSKCVHFQDPLQLAQSAKNRGNKYFKAGRFDKSIECYTEAINVCPPENRDDIATFYQNRAAAYEQLVSTKCFLLF